MILFFHYKLSVISSNFYSIHAADALKMVDPAKTPAKSAALLRKEAAIARKAAIKAKESKKGGVRPPVLVLIYVYIFY